MEEQNLNLTGKALDDYNLIQKALKGDEKSFAKLLARYRNPVYFMLLKMVNNHSDAEDLTLEAFSKAFKNLHLYTPKNAFSSWLFRIATNNCVDFLRKTKDTELKMDENPISNDNSIQLKIKTREPNPEERLIRLQRAIILRKLVGTLKPRYQQLIELRYFGEYTYEEIAHELKIPVGTVKAQLFRARELLFGQIAFTELADND